MVEGIEERIAALAREQHGVVTRAQLLDLGLLGGAIGRRVAAGRLRRLHRGVFLVGLMTPPRAREMAAVLACGPAAIVSHRTAAALWELIPAQDDSLPVDVMLTEGCGESRRGIRVHRVAGLDSREWTKLDGIPVTTPARTLVDLAADVGSGALERALARAEREGLLGRTTPADLLAMCSGRPGAALLRAVVSRSGGPALTRSEAEARFLQLVRRAGLPAPEVNVIVAGYEIDFLWRALGVAVEVDGFRYHSSRSRFETDHRRGTRLGAHGIQLIRLTWRQIVEDELATAVQLAQTLVRAELR